MFKFFKRKSEKEKIQEEYNKLIKEAYVLSRTNRLESDKKTAEAEELLKILVKELNS